MIPSTFYAEWIKETKSPFSRTATLKDLDKAIKSYCSAISTPKAAAAQAAVLNTWDAWQKSKEFQLGWWNSERRVKSTNGIFRKLCRGIITEVQGVRGHTAIGSPYCYDSPHPSRLDGPELAFTLSAQSSEVWNISSRQGHRSDTFIGCTNLTDGVCHMLPTYEQCDVAPLSDASQVHNPIWNNSTKLTYAYVKETWGRPPRFGSLGMKFIIGGKQDIDGFYHNTLMKAVGVNGDIALGWALQGCPARGAGWFRFVSSKNSGKFDLPNTTGHEGRDLPPAWAKSICECVGGALGLKLEKHFSKSVSGKGASTRIRKFSC